MALHAICVCELKKSDAVQTEFRLEIDCCFKSTTALALNRVYCQGVNSAQPHLAPSFHHHYLLVRTCHFHPFPRSRTGRGIFS